MKELKRRSYEVNNNYVFDVKVILEKAEKDKDKDETLEQLVQQIDITEMLDESQSLVLKRLIFKLKNDYNFPLENKQIHYFLVEGDIFMNCGLEPLNEDIKIRKENYENDRTITIKGRDLGISLVHRLMSFQVTTNANQQKQKNGGEDGAQNNKCRRTKERRIGHIIDKVIEWRKYYAGTSNDRNQKYSLQEAAKNVGISKKSLDDYLFQIRFGHKYGFNFNEHYNDKVGVLRDFVRQNKKNDKNEIKHKKNQRFEQQQ